MASSADVGADSDSVLADGTLQVSTVGSLLARAGPKAASGHLEVAVGSFVASVTSIPPFIRRFVLIADSSIYVFASSQHSEQALGSFTLSASSVVRSDPFSNSAFAFEVSDRTLNRTWMYALVLFSDSLISADCICSFKAPSKTAKATWLQTLNMFISTNKSTIDTTTENPSLINEKDDIYDVLSSYEDETDSDPVFSATNLPLTPQQQKFMAKSKPVDYPPVVHSKSRGLFIPAPSMPPPILQNAIPAKAIEEQRDLIPRQQQYNRPVSVQQFASTELSDRRMSTMSNYSINSQHPPAAPSRPVSILQQPLQNPLITQSSLLNGRSSSQQGHQPPIPARRSSDASRTRRAIPMPNAVPGRLSSASASSSLASTSVSLPPMNVLPPVMERSANAVNSNAKGPIATPGETTSLFSGSAESLSSEILSSQAEPPIPSVDGEGQQELVLLRLQLERAKLELLDQLQMSKILLEAQKNGGSEGLVGSFTGTVNADVTRSSNSPMPSITTSERDKEKKNADSASIKSDKSKRSFTWFGRRRREGK
ncbi:hypothetical protein HDU84_003758 [Entophlyctis sp. JEL0112]|nr:hypothetical protein HDU84_003758 [Entophlyctis sp. JEL0112]